MNYNYLHIFHDEKFTNIIVRQFIETEVQKQRFIILYEPNQVTPKYQLDPLLPIDIIFTDTTEYDLLLKDLSDFPYLFIHFLCDLKSKLIEKTPSTTKIIWMCWGQDIHKLLIADSYLPLTRGLLKKNRIFKEYYWKYTLWLRRMKFPFSQKGSVLKRIQYCCPVIEGDLKLINKKLNLNIKFLPFHYGSLEGILAGQINNECNSNNILVGNSSTYASNHLDAFNVLTKFDLNGRLIVVPLNYGDQKYGDQIDVLGKHLFKENFSPLRTFLASPDYSTLVAGCSIAIFNHIRQQALGNIIISLWLGARVYLNKKSILFAYLKSLGLTIFCIQDDLRITNIMALKELPKEDKHINKQILLQEFGNTNTLKLTRNVLKEIVI